ncbi:MAG: DNA-directed RNA polymerase subunit alpha [Spirochaetia bacterium]|nr:DNA-directed RNA polymerase subunit alpha [Spirochaetota bacterium]MCX8096324.1 DNA-directed RNA polymerase subunit alpha [Spirochaetota bacterium]MDW8112315.1 DNA-directed RNA polymerase subunit alpha [Spirochaetia bacterium]
MDVTRVLGLFTFPKEVICDRSSLTSNYAKVIISPLDEGFGTTLGNSLRRVLLSSIPGYAISAVKIDGILHEFSPIEGAKEDYIDFILSLKQVRLKLNSGQDRKEVFISLEGEGNFKAGDLSRFDSDIVVFNPELELLTLNEDARLKIKLVITYGKGAILVDEIGSENGNVEVGLIPIDAIYSPVKRANFDVETVRVNNEIKEKLILEIETDGSVSPVEAYNVAIEVLKSYVRSIAEVSIGDINISKVEGRVIEVREIIKKLSASIEELNLSAKTFNILKESGITKIYDLVSKHEEELKFRSFGKKSIEEVRKKLDEWGLSIGMHLPKEVVEEFEKGS